MTAYQLGLPEASPWQQAMLPLMPPSPLTPDVGGVVQAQRTEQPDVRVCTRVGCTNPAIGTGEPYCEAHDWTREPVDGERTAG